MRDWFRTSPPPVLPAVWLEPDCLTGAQPVWAGLPAIWLQDCRPVWLEPDCLAAGLPASKPASPANLS